MRPPAGRLQALAAALIALSTSAASPPAVEGLKSEAVAVRRAAANDLRFADRAPQKQALTALIDRLMKEKDGQVRLAVLDAVTALGPDAEAAVPALVHALRTDAGGDSQEKSHQDYRAALALAAIGKPAVAALRGLLNEPKDNVRAEVAMALGKIGPDASEAVPDLAPWLKKGSARVRREAALALGRIGPAAVAPLAAASSGPEPEERLAAVAGLGNLTAPDERATGALLAATNDPAPEVRGEAVRALAGLDLPEDVLVPIIRANLRHHDERPRYAAVALLVGRPALLPLMAPDLESLLTAGHEGSARHAAFLLGKCGPDGARRLLAALPREGAPVELIARGLAQVGRPALARLLKAVEGPDPRVRRAAALALGKIRPLAPETVSRLTAGLSDPDPETRTAFLTALGELGPRAAGSSDAVRALLRDETPEIRRLAAAVLFQVAPRDPRLIDDLTNLLAGPDAQAQRQALDALRALGPPGQKALPAVIGRLASEDAGVRLAAALMVDSHGPAASAAIPALTGLLKDPDPKVRTTAATTLGKFGKASQSAFKPLAALLDDPRPEAREAAASALGGLELDAETVRPFLARALRDDTAEVRRAASRAIPRLGPQGSVLIPDIIRMAARKENLRSVDRLLRPFEREGPSARSLPELIELLKHEQTDVRYRAVKFLGLAGPSAREALPALERALGDPSPEVREQAKAACEQVKKEGRPAPQPDRAGEAAQGIDATVSF